MKNKEINITEAQRLLIMRLKGLSIEEDAIVGIILSLETEEQQLDMLDFLAEKEMYSISEILKKVVEISE